MPVAIRIDYAVGNAEGRQAIESLRAAFERADANLTDFGRFIFPRLGPVFEAELGAQFDAEGQGPFAGAWAPLSPRYAAHKSVRWPGQPTLVASGTLREALTNSDSPFAARDYSATEWRFGTAGVSYATFHQRGTSKMPARPPFDFTPQLEEAMKSAAHLGIVDGLRAADTESILGVTS